VVPPPPLEDAPGAEDEDEAEEEAAELEEAPVGELAEEEV